jgi:hypothetical protein
MIDNADQDEGFNLYLYLGSYWVNTSRDTRLDTILDTIPDTKSRPELRSLDQLIELKTETELDGKESRYKVELNPDVWGPGLLLSQFRITYWRRISSWTISSIFIIYRINQDQDQLYVVRCVRTNPDFSKSIVSSQITGNEVLILF